VSDDELTMRQATTFAIEDLCLFSKYVNPLREEIEHSSVSMNNLPLLDSFLKESIRYNCIDASESFTIMIPK
jgi:hypothetical protein